MPPVSRTPPLHLQVAGFYRKQITDGILRPGDRLPSMRDIAQTSGVAFQTAQRAVEHLKTEGLVRTEGQSGTFVAEPRAAIGPQQRIRLAGPPASETHEVLSAGLVVTPAYILPVLGLRAGDAVLRREWVTWEQGSPAPARLSVTWHRPEVSVWVPELLEEAPVPDPRGSAGLIAARYGVPAGDLSGYSAFECRRVKDDGRESPLLGVDPESCVLAGVWTWRGPVLNGEPMEYGEFVIPPGRVIESDLEP